MSIFFSTVLYVVLFHFMFCFMLRLGLKMFDAAFGTSALQIFTPQLLPQLSFTTTFDVAILSLLLFHNFAVSKSRFWHRKLRCQSLD